MRYQNQVKCKTCGTSHRTIDGCPDIKKKTANKKLGIVPKNKMVEFSSEVKS